MNNNNNGDNNRNKKRSKSVKLQAAADGKYPVSSGGCYIICNRKKSGLLSYYNIHHDIIMVGYT